MYLFSTPLKLLFWLTGTSSSAAKIESLPLPESVIRVGDEDAAILASGRFVLWWAERLCPAVEVNPEKLEEPCCGKVSG
jgi:cob(I)alamin adenosyltransferase